MQRFLITDMNGFKKSLNTQEKQIIAELISIFFNPIIVFHENCDNTINKKKLPYFSQQPHKTLLIIVFIWRILLTQET